MSLHLPVRRAVTPVVSQTPFAFVVPYAQQRRNRSWWPTFTGWGKHNTIDPTPAPKNPLTEEFLKKKPANREQLVRGDLSSSSIFEDEALAGPKPTEGARKTLTRNPEMMAAALDPDPKNRRRWERKMVVREVHKRGRLTRAQILKKQERQIISKSQDFKTSVKKLVPLAKQITGKTVDEAIIQMRFSKKKAARDVKEHLEHARNEAIVKRGMGLGAIDGKKVNPVQIQTKDGKRIKVADPTTIYIEQAWVGRGLYTRTPEHRARGAINMLTNPTTSLSVVLKEEATRIRLHNERLEKIKNRKVWVQLPNRPVTAQRQYYSW